MTSVSESLIRRQELIQPEKTNTYGNAHGGEIVKIMDEIAAMSAMRVSSKRCVTARISEVGFHTPIKEGDMTNVEAFVYNTGRTSLDVYASVKRERPTDSKVTSEPTTTALFTMVAIDEDGKPVETDPVTEETDKCRKLLEKVPKDL